MFVITYDEGKLYGIYLTLDEAKKKLIELWSEDEDFKYNEYKICEYILNKNEYIPTGLIYVLFKSFGEDFRFLEQYSI